MFNLSKIFSNPKPQVPTVPAPTSEASPQPAEIDKLHLILSAIKDGVIALDSSNSIVFANPSAEKLTGYGQVEMIGRKIDQLIKLKDQEDKDLPIINYCQTKPEKPLNLTGIVVKMYGKNNLLREVEITPTMTDSASSSNLNCILLIHDISQEKNFQQMQVDFVSMASHEFRSPLTSIRDYLAVLKEEASASLKADQLELLDRALISTNQLTTLVDNILNVSKIERGSYLLSLKTIDWQKTLQKVVEDSKIEAIKKNIEIILDLPPNLPQVLADEIRINEVLNNLINNSIKYTKEGGTIKVGANFKGNEVITFISDNGIGIAKEVLPNLFNKFYRAPGSLEKVDKGTGLGLYISKSIIDLHHGKIWVESEMGKGSIFYFTLPVAGSFPEGPSIVQLEKMRS